MRNLLKQLLPDRSMLLPVCAGPFRGARIVANPRASLRKVLGLYEHELNGWLTLVLPKVSRLIDVGANDGYFAFGCAAAMRRAGTQGEIICFEPQRPHQDELTRGFSALPSPRPAHRIVSAFAGDRVGDGVTTLDALDVADRDRTLIKIDVEGAERDVIAGAASWLRPSNFFLIEVHRYEDVAPIAATFANQHHPLVQIDQRPLPLLGREQRDADNRWLVSELSAAR